MSPAESAADLRTKSSIQSLGPGPLIINKNHISAFYIKAAWGKSEVLLPKQLPRCIFSSHLFFIPYFTGNHSFSSLGVPFDTVTTEHILLIMCSQQEYLVPKLHLLHARNTLLMIQDSHIQSTFLICMDGQELTRKSEIFLLLSSPLIFFPSSLPLDLTSLLLQTMQNSSSRKESETFRVTVVLKIRCL